MGGLLVGEAVMSSTEETKVDVLWVIHSINGIPHGWVTSSFHTQGDSAWHEITQGDFESTND